MIEIIKLIRGPSSNKIEEPKIMYSQKKFQTLHKDFKTCGNFHAHDGIKLFYSVMCVILFFIYNAPTNFVSKGKRCVDKGASTPDFELELLNLCKKKKIRITLSLPTYIKEVSTMIQKILDY